MIRRYVPKMKFIIIGDFQQFKPVKDRYEGTYEHSAALYTLVDFQRINLTKCRRSDAELFELYTHVDKVKAKQFPFKELTDLNIAYTHATRKRVNELCMEKFNQGKPSMQAFPSRINKKTQVTQVYEGLPIVAHRNLKKEKIYNSEMFVVSKIDMRDKTFSFFNDEEEMTMPIEKFSSMFYPAYCITCHVSQGCTFDKKYTIWDWNFERMDQTARYVALSRATKKENIQIKL
jgi:ATP-dependent exoDNAse (exonuclease V) alpha subunit